MEVILVSAIECNADGKKHPQVQRVKMEINTDLIAAQMDSLLYLKDGPVIQLGDRYFRDFQKEKKQARSFA